MSSQTATPPNNDALQQGAPLHPQPPHHRRTARPPRRRVKASRVVLYATLTAGSLFMVLPFVWMLLTSLKTPVEIASFPPTWIPREWRFENYLEALRAAPFGYYFRNSLFISLGQTTGTVVFGAMTGYALARMRFRGRELVFLLFISMMMVPTYVKVLPQFLMMKMMPLFGGNDWLGQGGTGWLDTWWALIIPGGISPFAIFLFRQFYLTLPRDLEEAARIDGMSEFGIFARIMTPLIKPAIATVALLQFQNSWNNFLWPLLVTTRQDLRVIQLGLAVFQQSETTAWAYLMAGTTLATIPMVLLFLFAQRYFVQGLSGVAVKG
ncbi:carbohydrate ABC transporter permease [Egicoccus sp. AB-alg6-2]|uniref:carbohydrate ABC transporter permease n=1 Tax=Egicoccus sp. AB-alg6-2 TaxID=3242692 RepID=UPI00359D87E9